MLTVSGLLLGAVLTAPGAVRDPGLADPFETTSPRVVIAHNDRALGLRDPFAPDPHLAARAHARRLDAPSTPAELRDPFESARQRRAHAAAPAAAAAPLQARHALPPSASPDLRDPFGR